MNMFKKLLLLDCHICPWWLAYTFDNRFRRLFHDTEKMLGPYVKEGMTAIDIGCGMGYLTIGMANLVGEKGSVIAVDIQQNMLNVLGRRAEKAGVAHRIHLHRSEPDRIGIDREVDFALTFWMVHEVPHRTELLEQIFQIIIPTGKYLLVEPKVHVSRACFEEITDDCMQIGFKTLGDPKISLSRAALLEKPRRISL
jgi:ubiquinone/menaquinone biosynthesis C-methylase UbiE